MPLPGGSSKFKKAIPRFSKPVAGDVKLSYEFDQSGLRLFNAVKKFDYRSALVCADRLNVIIIFRHRRGALIVIFNHTHIYYFRCIVLYLFHQTLIFDA